LNGVSASATDSLNGVRFGGGLEVSAAKDISVRLEYQRTNWKDSTDSDGTGTFSVDPTEDTARIGVIFSF
jgi:opacity protein-like surface antigen